MSNTIQKALLVEQDSYGTYSNILHVVLQKGKKIHWKKVRFSHGCKNGHICGQT